jgi:hypothetical protein
MTDYNLQEKIFTCCWLVTLENEYEVKIRFEEKFGKQAPAKSSMYYWRNKLLETGSLSNDRQRTGNLFCRIFIIIYNNYTYSTSL